MDNKKLLIYMGFIACIHLTLSDNITEISSKVPQQKEMTSRDFQHMKQQHEIDIEKKKSKVVNFVNRAREFIDKEGIKKACPEFTRSKDWVDGDLFIFVFDIHGFCLAHGNDSYLLWRNMFQERDFFHIPIIQTMLDVTKNGGGWVTYEWKGASKISYVREIESEGSRYIIGSGFFPHSKEHFAITLVKGAVALFRQALHDGRPVKEAFSNMNYPIGHFVYGDLYISAYSFDGVVYADGEQPAIVGSHTLNVIDRRGEYPVQKMINAVKNKDKHIGVWVDFERRNATKRAYVEWVEDNEGQKYIISCGYYPDVQATSVEQLVRRGYEYLKKTGIKDATYSFTDVNDHTYNYGGTYLLVYTLAGECLADGSNPENVGQNFYHVKDEDGRYYVQELIKKAKKGGGWINTRLRNSLVSFYVKLVKVGDTEVILASLLFPTSKTESTFLLVKSAIECLQEKLEQEAFSQFVRSNGPYARGDLSIDVYDSDGLCYVYGDNRDVIWRNLLDVHDDDGRPIVKILINIAANGPGTAEFTMNGCQKIAYAENVEKNGKTYTVTSSYYL